MGRRRKRKMSKLTGIVRLVWGILGIIMMVSGFLMTSENLDRWLGLLVSVPAMILVWNGLDILAYGRVKKIGIWR